MLPGFGWDNLRNVNQGQVVNFNFSKCRTTDDGRFLLPDTVSAIPIKASRVQVFAELITHWTVAALFFVFVWKLSVPFSCFQFHTAIVIITCSLSFSLLCLPVCLSVSLSLLCLPACLSVCLIYI